MSKDSPRMVRAMGAANYVTIPPKICSEVGIQTNSVVFIRVMENSCGKYIIILPQKTQLAIEEKAEALAEKEFKSYKEEGKS